MARDRDSPLNTSPAFSYSRAVACVSSRSCVRDGHGGDTKTMRSRRYLDAVCRTTRTGRSRSGSGYTTGYVCARARCTHTCVRAYHVVHEPRRRRDGGGGDGTHASSSDRACRRLPGTRSETTNVLTHVRGLFLTIHNETFAKRGSERTRISSTVGRNVALELRLIYLRASRDPSASSAGVRERSSS